MKTTSQLNLGQLMGWGAVMIIMSAGIIILMLVGVGV